MPVTERATSLKFGTSGLRGLVVDLAGAPARRWVQAFLRHLDQADVQNRIVLVGRDLRSSSPGIALDCMRAAIALGWQPLDCGALPTPALAREAMARNCAAIMVTGSHIPDDRNGLKFYTPDGEITKQDEAAILAAFDAGEMPGKPEASDIASIADLALYAYKNRYLEFFDSDALSGLTVGLYEQSSVARDVVGDILAGLGAVVLRFGRSDAFIAIDTEAHRPEDIELFGVTARRHRLDAIVSTDGDADRPLVTDAEGVPLRGDILGLMTAAYLGLETIVTPVTSSSAVESSGLAKNVRRTKVGSPFVIAGMVEAGRAGLGGILGFEPNGGVLTGSDIVRERRLLATLPTRDAVLPIVCALALASAGETSVREAASGLGDGHALADRLKNVPGERSVDFLGKLANNASYASDLMAGQGGVASVSDLDGVRFVLNDGSVVHFRASGNAPELRVYVEAPLAARAEELLRWGLEVAAAATAA